jgi:hypothetical protein
MMDLVLGVIAIVCLCLPCRYDPAIRFKEWIDNWDKEPPDEGEWRDE